MTTPLERDPTNSFDRTALQKACEAAFRNLTSLNEVAVFSAARALVRDMRFADIPPEQMLVAVKETMSVEHLSGRHDTRAAAKWDRLCERAVQACIRQYYALHDVNQPRS